MRFLAALSLAATAATLASSCATTSTAAPSAALHAKDFAPLAIGDKWKYQLTPALPDAATAEVKIVDKDAQGFFIDDKGGRLAPRTDGVFDGAKNRFLIEEPVEAGHEWIAVPNDHPSDVQRLKITDTATSAHVPAGNFDGCIVVEATEPDENPHTHEKVVLRSTWTFAPNVGIVKFVQRVEPEKSPPFVAATMELVSYELAKADAVSRLTEGREVAAFGIELVQAYRRTYALRSEIRAVQEKRLRAVLDAAAKTRFYGPGPLRSLADVKPTRKADLLERIEESVVDPALTRARLVTFVNGGGEPGATLLDKYIVATTSGTTGQVGVFVDDVEGWARQRAVVFARMFQGMLKPEGFALLARRRYRLAFVVANAGHTLTSILGSRVPKVGQRFADSRVLSIDAPLRKVVDELNEFQPLLLHTYPTFLEVLAAEKRKGTLRIEPEIITAGSEPTSQQCREAVRAAFPRSRFVETYAATECVAMAIACPHGNLHVNEDACILEPVDDELQPVPFGRTASRVLVTNLLNTVQPLLRYELTDSLELDDAPCPCGSPFLRAKVFGRTDDTFFLIDDDGRAQVHPPIPLEVALLGLAGLLQYQLVHERQNRLRLCFVVDGDAAARAVATGLEQRMSRYLDEHGLLRAVDFVVEQVDAIERHARSKKLRQITSRVPRPLEGPVVAASEARRG